MTADTETHRWHCLSVAAATEALDVDPARGLSTAEADLRRRRHGENALAETKSRPLWLRFLDQFRNLLVIVLLFAAALAWTIGDLKDALVILVVVILNAALGFYQEHHAERTLSTLKAMVAVRARVRRDGRVGEVEATDLVPGDLVLLEAGDRVPADGRLIKAPNLEVDEAALTGESHPVGKCTQALDTADPPVAERLNMLYMNTVVTRGRAEMLVVDTGMTTEIGRLAGLIAETRDSETPLQRQLDTLGKRLAAIAGVIVALIFVLDLTRGLPWTQAAITAVALAVAAIPEGLPAVVTVTLAIGMWRMAQNQAILKKLSAVETLGSTTVICSDKTGTLTLNRMTGRAGWFAGARYSVDGDGYGAEGALLRDDPSNASDPIDLARPMALCNESRVRDGELIGDPTEGALWVLARKAGLDPESEQARRPRIAEIPFDSAHKFMATFHHAGDQVELFVKGAPDILLSRSTHWLNLGGAQPLDAATRERIEAENEHLANQALRVLAVARRIIPARDFDPAEDLWRWAEGWTFLGLAGLMDPPRP
jgi:P-type Ca2+ transporter type 2C